MADGPGIKINKDEFVQRMRKRFGTLRTLGASPRILGQPEWRFARGWSGEDVDSRVRCCAEDKLSSMPECPEVMDVEALNTYVTTNGLLLNKIELENLVSYYGDGSGGTRLLTFLRELSVDTRGEDPQYSTMYAPQSPNEAHLALSGVSHIEFGVAYKPFPKHWGVPPNAQMKGHDGIMRDLPGGYGKGNVPMYNWVQGNMQADKKSETNERGVKPYPYGNYSL